MALAHQKPNKHKSETETTWADSMKQNLNLRWWFALYWDTKANLVLLGMKVPSNNLLLPFKDKPIALKER